MLLHRFPQTPTSSVSRSFLSLLCPLVQVSSNFELTDSFSVVSTQALDSTFVQRITLPNSDRSLSTSRRRFVPSSQLLLLPSFHSIPSPRPSRFTPFAFLGHRPSELIPFLFPLLSASSSAVLSSFPSLSSPHPPTSPSTQSSFTSTKKPISPPSRIPTKEPSFTRNS